MCIRQIFFISKKGAVLSPGLKVPKKKESNQKLIRICWEEINNYYRNSSVSSSQGEKKDGRTLWSMNITMEKHHF